MALPFPPNIVLAKEGSLSEVLARHASNGPDKLAYCFLADGEEAARLTYAELLAQSYAIAEDLRECTEPGDRALLLYMPGLEFIPAFFGCLFSGVIAVPAYPPRPERPGHGQEILSRVCQDCTPRVVLTGGEGAVSIAMACRTVPELSLARWINTSQLSPTRCESPQVDVEGGERIAYLQYTSGSTGFPKGVMVSHGNLMHNSEMIARIAGHFEVSTAGGCGMSWLPFQHDMGLVGHVLQALYVGAPLYQMSPLSLLQRPFEWLQAISKYRANTSAGPNFAYNLCARRHFPSRKRVH